MDHSAVTLAVQTDYGVYLLLAWTLFCALIAQGVIAVAAER
ncbi:MAG: hypothetical protein AAF415_08575 [Pseudomonadota bacterium]